MAQEVEISPKRGPRALTGAEANAISERTITFVRVMLAGGATKRDNLFDSDDDGCSCTLRYTSPSARSDHDPLLRTREGQEKSPVIDVLRYNKGGLTSVERPKCPIFIEK